MQTLEINKPLDLSKVPDQEILFRMKKLSRTERKITHLVLIHINEVDSRKLYLPVGYDSLYKYLTQHLGYSESAAYDRIQAARVLRKNPQIAVKIECGDLNLSQLVKVEQSLKLEKKLGRAASQEVTESLLEKIENKSSFETSKILACELNQPLKTSQSIKPQRDGSARVAITLNERQTANLKKAQSLMSHSVIGNDVAEAIDYLAEFFIQKIEGKQKYPQIEGKNKKLSNKDRVRSPVVKRNLKNLPLPTQGFGKVPLTKNLGMSSDKNANKILIGKGPEKNANKNLIGNGPDKNTNKSLKGKTPEKNSNSFLRRKRTYISVNIRREVFRQADHCCEHIHAVTGKRCQSQFQLQLDHIHPLALGGSNDHTNLRVLCGVHNRQEALRWGLSVKTKTDGSARNQQTRAMN